MDAAIAEILWKRSIERHGFRYVTLLSDGDARTYNHIASLNVYGDRCHIKKSVSTMWRRGLEQHFGKWQQRGVRKAW